VPSTVAQVFAAARLEPARVVRWGERVPEARAGVYAVALSANSEQLKALPIAPVSMAAVGELLAARPELTLDGTRPSARALAERIASFWPPDETIVYIGLAGTSLRTRVRDYHVTPLGARRPHAGGWFIKALANLNDLFVHFAPVNDPGAAENAMIGSFCSRVSEATLAALRDPAHPFPFANLEWPAGVRKAHGIKGARGDIRQKPSRDAL
jgi:hypothetical protein